MQLLPCKVDVHFVSGLVLDMHDRLDLIGILTEVFMELGMPIPIRVLRFILFPQAGQCISLTLELLFNAGKQGLELLPPVVRLDFRQFGKEHVQLKVCFVLHVFPGQFQDLAFLYIASDGIAGYTAQTASFLEADTLLQVAQDLSNFSHRDCFVGHSFMSFRVKT